MTAIAAASPFRLDYPRPGIARVTIDVPGEKLNIFSVALAAPFHAAIDAAAGARGLVLLSGKPDSFIGGADLKDIGAAATAGDAEALSRAAQRMLKRVEDLPMTVVVVLHGVCMGLGTELALACHYRIATEHPKTSIALPEVKLGLLPGAAGTQRLPRLIPLPKALDMILTGRAVSARQALAAGLVDDVVRPEEALDAALRAAERPRPKRGRSWTTWPFVRGYICEKAREQTRKKAGAHYPSPLWALEAVEAGLDEGVEAGEALEARRFGEAVVSPTSKGLRGLFFATQALKREAEALNAPKLNTIGVVGCGTMGAGIAAVAALEGLNVNVREVTSDALERGLAQVRSTIERRVTRGSMTADDALRTIGRVKGGLDDTGLSSSDVIIEAVFEDLKLKQEVFERLSKFETVLASNTSCLPIAQIAARAPHPERVIGLHFFSPVPAMPLLEIIATPKTDPAALARGCSVALAMGKIPIVVRDSPGFYTSRVIGIYMAEAGLLVEEGVPVDLVDLAALRFGFVQGPFDAMDGVGLDIVKHVSTALSGYLGPAYAAPKALDRLLESGAKGIKTGRGFYVHEKRKAVNPLIPRKPMEYSREWEERLALRFVREAWLCLEEGILRSEVDGDVGAVLGIGFPPFRGGPFAWVAQEGRAAIRSRLEALASKHGERFAPPKSLHG